MRTNEYEVTSTSSQSWKVRDIPLTEGKLTRKILRTEIIKNSKDARKSVKICLVHQKRNKESDAWADLQGPTLIQTKAAEPAKFQIDTSDTLKLFEALADLYQIDPKTVGHGKVTLKLADASRIIETDASRAELIRQILQANHSKEVWEILVELQPDLVNKLSALRRLESRKKDLELFESRLDDSSIIENQWRAFIKGRPWLLGSAHVKILDETSVDLKHDSDIPLQVDGMFMDIVELKRPDSKFWQTDKHGELFAYRKKFLIPHWELDAAIAQVSGYILQAEKNLDSKDFAKYHGAIPLRPRGIVIYGRSADWGEQEWTALRLLNSRLHGVTILTFDQVLDQGKRLLELYEAELPEALKSFSGEAKEAEET